MTGKPRGLYARTRAWAARSDTVRGWREQRYRMFVELCELDDRDRILDVGAGRGAALERFNKTNEIVAIDLRPVMSEWLEQSNVTVLEGDGTQLPFADAEFSVVFSNSVIEHVPAELQTAFAEEIRRVGRRYFVQTPNRNFPIEPHYQFPFFQYLPRRVQKALNRRFTLGFRAKGSWEDVRLLTKGDLARLFPDAEIHSERLFGLTKSHMAVRR